MAKKANDPEVIKSDSQDYVFSNDIKDFPNTEKIVDIRGSGNCLKCGRYFDVPIIDGVPQCKCMIK